MERKQTTKDMVETRRKIAAKKDTLNEVCVYVTGMAVFFITIYILNFPYTTWFSNAIVVVCVLLSIVLWTFFIRLSRQCKAIDANIQMEILKRMKENLSGLAIVRPDINQYLLQKALKEKWIRIEKIELSEDILIQFDKGTFCVKPKDFTLVPIQEKDCP